MIDYLIIGSGLAGIAFAETALQQHKTIFVLDGNTRSASKVAAGIYNPVVLKRFTSVWEAEEQLELMSSFYTGIEAKLNSQLNYRIPLLRKFFSIEEQNNWFSASDKKELEPYLSTQLITDKFNGIDSPFDYGLVYSTGYIDVALLLEEYRKYLQQQNLFSAEVFYHDQLQIFGNHVGYKNIKAKHIIFAEGFGMHSNPFFKELPLDGAKGEILLIKAPLLNLSAILNTSIFILPQGNDLFKIGATYNWTDKSDLTTTEARLELVSKLKEVISCDFEIINQYAAVRPTVRDRKPLIGTHPNHSQVHLLNGLGTRGVMLGPAMAKRLFDYIETAMPIEREIDIRRYIK